METSLSLRSRMLELGTAVSILSEHDVEDELVCHFDTPPTLQDLPTLLRMLGFDDPRAMMRTGEPVTRALSRPRRASGCSRPSRSAPSPLERSILVIGDGDRPSARAGAEDHLSPRRIGDADGAMGAPPPSRIRADRLNRPFRP